MLPTFEIHSLYWPNMSPDVVALHRRCFEHIGIPVTYTVEEVHHAVWMDRIIEERLPSVDIVGFVDIDCLAYSSSAVTSALEYVSRTGSFLGLAQSSNHLHTAMRIFAAPAFLLISKRAYALLGRPSMLDGPDGDVAQSLSAAADALGFGYRVLYPLGYYRPNVGVRWRLGNFGFYGQGTEFDGGFFHNFNSRSSEGIDLLRERAEAILANEPQPRVLPHMSSSLDTAFIEASQVHPMTLRQRLSFARWRVRRLMRTARLRASTRGQSRDRE